MTAPDENWLIEIAARLDRVQAVPDDVLGAAVVRYGACMQTQDDGEPPGWLHDVQTDRELAARLCAGCPVQDECLELELRLLGEQTVGVWGALGEDDRRALHPIWRRHRDQGGGDRR